MSAIVTAPKARGSFVCSCIKEQVESVILVPRNIADSSARAIFYSLLVDIVRVRPCSSRDTRAFLCRISCECCLYTLLGLGSTATMDVQNTR
jgi:hypothetical protein